MLTPNPPIDRLKYIQKLYGEKQPWVVLDTLSVILSTVGVDDPSDEFDAELERGRLVRCEMGRRNDLAAGLRSRCRWRSEGRLTKLHLDDADVPLRVPEVQGRVREEAEDLGPASQGMPYRGLPR